MLEWRYFGCGSQTGHYLFDEQQRKVWGNSTIDRRLGQFDGILPPLFEEVDYHASFTRLGGLEYSALSWWDRSVDKRPGSNSTIFAPSLIITPEELLSEARKKFPWVFNRLPKEITLPPSY